MNTVFPSRLSFESKEVMSSAQEEQLFDAVHSQQLDVVVDLLQSKADPNAKRKGWHVLHQAASLQSQQILVALLGARAKVNVRSDKIGWTALHYAAHFGRRHNIRILCAHNEVEEDPKDWVSKVPEDIAEDGPAEEDGTAAISTILKTKSTLSWSDLGETFHDLYEASEPLSPSEARNPLMYHVRLPVFTTTKGVIVTLKLASERSVQRATEDTEGFAEYCRDGIPNKEPRVWNARLVTKDIQVRENCCSCGSGFRTHMRFCAPFAELCASIRKRYWTCVHH